MHELVFFFIAISILSLIIALSMTYKAVKAIGVNMTQNQQSKKIPNINAIDDLEARLEDFRRQKFSVPMTLPGSWITTKTTRTSRSRKITHEK